MHAREQIREAIKALLHGQIEEVGQEVHVDRVYPADKLPAIHIYSGECPLDLEQSDMGVGGKTNLAFEYQIAIDVIVKAVDRADALLDSICASVETLLGGDESLGQKVKYLVPENMVPELDDESEQPLLRGRMTWRCLFTYLQGSPETLTTFD